MLDDNHEPFPTLESPLLLGPVGRECHPKYLSHVDMTKAITTVLQVLERLHSFGWCHCDVRWPNVILDVIGTGEFVLIDFEYARKVNEECPGIKKRFIHTDLQKENKWRKFGDTHQVVLMIQDWVEAHDTSHDSNIERALSTKWSASDLLEYVQGDMWKPTAAAATGSTDVVTE